MHSNGAWEGTIERGFATCAIVDEAEQATVPARIFAVVKLSAQG